MARGEETRVKIKSTRHIYDHRKKKKKGQSQEEDHTGLGRS